MDSALTVCDNAAAEGLPRAASQPITGQPTDLIMSTASPP
jgi:hypothetical protein